MGALLQHTIGVGRGGATGDWSRVSGEIGGEDDQQQSHEKGQPEEVAVGPRPRQAAPCAPCRSSPICRLAIQPFEVRSPELADYLRGLVLGLVGALDLRAQRCALGCPQGDEKQRGSGFQSLQVFRVFAEDVAQPAKEDGFTFYIAPLIGFGGFFTNDLTLNNYTYMNAEIRVGYKMSGKVMFLSSVDTGVALKGFTFPVMTTATFGPEYFFTDRISLLGAAGFSVMTTEIAPFPGQHAVRDVSAGFAWKAGVTLQMIKWGDKGQYNIPISLTYTGSKTNMLLCHTVLVSLGFMYFN